ncbi:MAG: dephospho-CoA kinase [Chitinophagales bacterium]|nr:dephospho-CoA kinase [Chitinophagales bacterium]MDW8418074.1 dephospho-CoA kinase [Chitinophagales bacterium]
MRRITTYPKGNVIKAGITGSIGSGKTTACRFFEALGIPVYYADERARYLMQHEHYLIEQLKKNFGEEIYDNGKLNRAYLAKMVFGDEKKLKLLNSIVHPAVFRDTERWINEQAAKSPPYVLKEAALLIESGAYRQLDKLIVVTAPTEVRLSRVMQRDGTSEQAVRERMAHQLPDEEKIKFADYVIENTGNLNDLQKKVMEIHRQLVGLRSDPSQ